MRTSIGPGHLDLKDRFVFELRASPNTVPSLTVAVDYDDEDRWFPVPIDQDGMFSLIKPLQIAGLHRVRLRAFVDGGCCAQTSRRIWVTTPGCDIVTEPPFREIKLGELYRAMSQLKADLGASWTGLVDYGDGTRELDVSPRPEGLLSLEHRYASPGNYRIWIALHDTAGRMAARAATCLVEE
jgi:hypothetical protein